MYMKFTMNNNKISMNMEYNISNNIKEVRMCCKREREVKKIHIL